MESTSELERKKKLATENAMQCARIGNPSELYPIIHSYPQLLQDLDQTQFADTPLHAAAKAGQTGFAVEILNLMPSLGSKLDADGLSPLHLAVRENKKDIAMALVRFDKQLVRVKGVGGFTPLHYASSISGVDKEILAEFLFRCPDAIDDLTNRFQTSVHLAVETNDCQSVKLILNWLVKTCRESVLGVKDVDGNTALHIAAKYNCIEGMKKMVSKAKINKVNNDGQTPLDIATEYYKLNDGGIRDVLQKEGALRGDQMRHKKSPAEYLLSPTSWWENFVRLYYFLIKDLTLEMRNVVLVVAALITTATYAAVLQPPGGINQVSADDSSTTTTLAAAAPPKIPGKMVMQKRQYDRFMPANTAAFTMSVVIIIFMLHGRPYNIILHSCLIFMSYSYLIALEIVSEDSKLTKTMDILAWYVISAAFAAKMLYYAVKALYEDVWWLPGGSVGASNLFDRCQKRRTFGKFVSDARAPRRQLKLLQSSDSKKQLGGSELA